MKRFYKDVSVEPAEAGWRVMLDSRPIRTAMGAAQIVPARALADAMASEWAQQGVELVPALFVLRDMADYAIDIAAPTPEAVIAGLLAYAETDTLCYRAWPDEPLYPRQLALWEPLLDAAEGSYAVRFERVSGIIHRPQPAETLTRLEQVLAALPPFQLAAVRTMAGLAASIIVALAALEPGADAEPLWQAANLEEDFQIELWGHDAEAEALRQLRLATFAAAVRFARLARGE